MRILFAVLALALCALFTGGATNAGGKDDKAKEVKLTGKICCLKCEVGEGDKCVTIIVVGKGKDETTYYFDAAGHKKHHAAICSTAMDGTVTGTVVTEGKKKVIQVKSVEFSK